MALGTIIVITCPLATRLCSFTDSHLKCIGSESVYRFRVISRKIWDAPALFQAYIRKECMTSPSSHTKRLPFMLHPDNTTNENLLRRYAKTGDAEAFAELVRRLAPMVLGVCKRAIADHQLAEDAVQAAFLVLARKPEAVRAPGTVDR